MSHTPGPWRISPHYKCGWSGVAKDPTPNRWQGIFQPIPGSDVGSKSAIVTVGIKGGEVDDYWLSIKEADAHMIAAAPDMLAALRGALTAWGAAKNGDIAAADWMNNAERVMLAALARAEGR